MTAGQRLPAPLTPWAQWLTPMARDLALAIGPWLTRLSAAVGPLPATSGAPEGPPDGFDGVTRRGPYHRLLASEWLLADEAPDEFLRRAAGGEHAFLAMAYRRPIAGGKCIALVDVGSDQLGSPRLAHLALLIVLARRAEAAGAGFAWGAVQAPARLRDGFDATSIEAWLTARIKTRPKPAHIDAWRAALADEDLRGLVWWIGGSRIAAGSEGVRVTVEIAPELGVRALDVTMTRPNGPRPTAARLPLPRPDVCVRLVRDPLHRQPSPPPALGLSYPARRLLLSAREHTVAALHVPNRAGDSRGATRSYDGPDGTRLVAGDWRRRRFCGIAVHEEDVFWLRSGVAPAIARPSDPLDPGGGGLLPYFWVEERETVRAWIIDARRRLHRLESNRERASSAGAFSIEVVDRDVVALRGESRGSNWNVAYVRVLCGRYELVRPREDSIEDLGVAPPEPAGVIPHSNRMVGVVRRSSTAWSGIASVHVDWPVEAEDVICGVVDHDASARPALIARVPTTGAVHLVPSNGRRITLPLGAAATDVIAHPRWCCVAARLDDGRVVVYDARRGAILLETRPEASW